jgi:hypothetical protein
MQKQGLTNTVFDQVLAEKTSDRQKCKYMIHWDSRGFLLSYQYHLLEKEIKYGMADT